MRRSRRLSSMLVSKSSAAAARSCSSASRVTRMAWEEQDLVAVVEPRQVQADHVLQQHEGVLAGRVGQRHEPRHDLARDVDDGERRGGQRRRRQSPDGGQDAQRPVAPGTGTGWPGSIGQRGQHGQQRPAEVVLEEPLLLLGDRPWAGGGGRPRRPAAAGAPRGSTRCCTSPARAPCADTAAMVSAGVIPSGPADGDRRRGAAA